MSKTYPGGTGTFSKAASQFPANAPRHAISGDGAHTLYEDSRYYLDWTCALGAVSLGQMPKWVERMQARIADGVLFGSPTLLEEEYATALAQTLPWTDSASKFGLHGYDVTDLAAWLARYITGRDRIYSIDYHGSGLTYGPNKNGVPKAVSDLTVETWTVFSEPAALLIVEADKRTDLKAMRAWCDATGTLLCFDEMLTGFRTPGYWHASQCGVTPDLIASGKAIGNGIPLSALSGRADLLAPLAGEVAWSRTHNSNALGMAAGIETLAVYQSLPVIEKMWTFGGKLQTHWNARASALGLDMPLTGQPSRTVVAYPSLAHRTLVSQEFFRRQIAMTVGFTVCWMHEPEDVARTLTAIDEVLEIVAKAGDDPARLVEGDLIALPFRRMTAL